MPCDDHAGPAGAASELSAVRDELLAREPLFHRRDLGTTREAYLALTAEDFWEVGASGQVYEREWVIDTVLKRGRVVGEEAWVVSDVRCRALSASTFAFTYQLDQAGRLTRRLTLWRRAPDGWTALYHQGTLIQGP